MRVLLVDDEVSNAQVLGLILEQEGYAVTVAGDARQALERLEQAAPQLLVTDVMMPGMSGFELAAAVRARAGYVDLPVLVMSGAPLEAFALEQLAGSQFLRKPFELEALLRAVRQLLEAPGARPSA